VSVEAEADLLCSTIVTIGLLNGQKQFEFMAAQTYTKNKDYVARATSTTAFRLILHGGQRLRPWWAAMAVDVCSEKLTTPTETAIPLVAAQKLTPGRGLWLHL
jgi:hypothetical protein